MKHKCSCCQAIVGKDEWSGFLRMYDNGSLCADCESDSRIKDAFQWYRMMIQNRWITLVFFWLYPMLMLMPLLMTGRVMIEWWCWPLCIAAWVCGFVNYRKRQWAKKIEEERERLWLLKMSE